MTPSDPVAAWLAGEEPAAVRRGEAGDVAALADAVQAAGWTLAHVDGAETATKSDFLSAVGVALAFPETYGRNLDAFADLLDDLPGATLLLWQRWGTLATADPRTFSVVVRLLAERAADRVRPPFAVLLSGPGPQVPGVDLPE